MSRIHYKVEHCAIVVLAAGVSSRLGSPKQLLSYRGESLLQHAVNIALLTTMHPMVVVIGAKRDVVKKELQGIKIEFADNEDWQEGMASSIRCGLNVVQKMNDKIDGIIFMVCDQPFVTQLLLGSILQKQHETGLPVVACKYEDKSGNYPIGTPVLFHRIFFDELRKLKGDTGARKLISKHEDMVATVDFPEGITDIDTRKDYENLLKQKTIV